MLVTAERAGFYKPHPRPYLLALEELGVAPDPESLFVAGSAYDLMGTAKAGNSHVLAQSRGLAAAAPGEEAPCRIQGHDLHALGAFV